MSVGERFAQFIGSEQDDLLSTFQLVAGERDLEDRLLERLVHLLLEGLFLDLCTQYQQGALSKLDHQMAITELSSQAHAVGLTPFGCAHDCDAR